MSVIIRETEHFVKMQWSINIRSLCCASMDIIFEETSFEKNKNKFRKFRLVDTDQLIKDIRNTVLHDYNAFKGIS